MMNYSELACVPEKYIVEVYSLFITFEIFTFCAIKQTKMGTFLCIALNFRKKKKSLLRENQIVKPFSTAGKFSSVIVFP